MKNSKKILAFLLSAFMVCTVPAVMTACNNDKEDQPSIEQPNEPSKVKDGTDISVAVGASAKITVSEYITANGKTVEASSSNPAVASAEIKDGAVTVIGKAKGTATVKLKCESIEVSFNVTVTAEAQKTPAPVFETATAALDLRLNDCVEVELAPKSGGDKFDFSYSLANSLVSGAEITENKLKFTSEEENVYTIKIAVKCTEKNNAENVYNLTFDVKITVTRSQEEKVYFKVTVDGVETQVEDGKTFTLPAFEGTVPEGKEFDGWKIGEDKKNAGDEITVTADVTVTSVFKTKVYTVTVDGEEHRIEHGETFTLPAFEGTVPEGKEFDGWQIGGEKKNAGDEITITADVTVTAVFKTKVYTVTIDGETQRIEHGGKVTLPAYEKEIEEGKQFLGWTDGTNTLSAGSEITVTGDLTITAVIENIPETLPELVKETDSVTLVLDSDRDSVTLDIADYLITNGHAVNVNNSEHEVATVNSTLTSITLKAVAFGSSTVTLTCKNLTVTITVNVAYPPSQVMQDVVTDTEIHDLFNGELILDLAENITYNAQVTGYKVNGEGVTGSTFKVTGDFGETAREVSFTVTALFEDTDPLEYTYKVTVKDTSAYRIINGSFDEWENGKPIGWTVTDGYGSRQDAETFFDRYPFDNIGAYFGETTDSKTGVLQTNAFKVGNSGWVSFQLGAAKPDKAVWVEVVNADTGALIAKFKNNQFSDPDNAMRLIPYKVNLSDYKGESVYIKIVDEAANANDFATFFADSFNSWHDAEPTVITVGNGEERTYINLGSPVFADMAASVDLKVGNEAEVTLPEAVWGVIGTEYTFTTSTEGAAISEDGTKLVFTAAKAGMYEVTVTGTTAFGSSEFKVTVTVTNTKERPEVEDKALGQINIDTENLTVTENLPEGNDNFALSYAIKEAVEGASVEGNVFTYVAPAGQAKGTVEVTLTVTFTDKAYTQDVYTEEITLSIEIVGNEPEIKEETVTEEIDLNGNESVAVSLDLAANVTVPASVAVTYSVNGEPVEGSVYSTDLNKGTHELTVKVHYGDNSELEYKFVVKVAQYKVINGDFETGTLDGWTYTVADGSSDFGRIDNETYYWVGKDGSGKLNKQGEWLFTGVETDETKGKVNLESGKGTLKSSAFTLKQNGWISFLMGGAHNIHCGVRVRAVSDDSILAEFNNQGKGFDAAMDRYIYKFTGMQEDTECYIEVFDDATVGWGLVAVDDFRTDWGSTRPDHEGATEIVPVYVKGQTQVYNGSFDEGNSGWDIVTTLDDGGVFAEVNTSGEDVAFVWEGNNNPYNNDGNFLQNMSEKSKGYALSSAFDVSESGWMTFKLGGNKANSYVAIIDADTGAELAKFVNEDFVPAFPTQGWEMYSYKVNLIESGIAAGTRVRIKIVDDATEDYGVVVADSFVTNYDAEPDENFKKINKVN